MPGSQSRSRRGLGERVSPGDYEVIPNGVLIRPRPTRRPRAPIVFVGRQEARKGFRPAARLARDPAPDRRGSPVSALIRWRYGFSSRIRTPSTGSTCSVSLRRSGYGRAARRQAFVSPALGGESFGMVLTRCLRARRRSSRPTSRDTAWRRQPRWGSVPPGDEAALDEAVTDVLADEQGAPPALGRGATRLAQEHYSWDDIARRMLESTRGRVTGPVAIAPPHPDSWRASGRWSPLSCPSGGAAPRGASIADVFTAVHWHGSSSRRAEPAVDLVRAASWHTVIRQAMPP